MPRGIPNQPRKNAAKKAAKKTTKRAAKAVKRITKKVSVKRTPRKIKPSAAPAVGTPTESAMPNPETDTNDRVKPADFADLGVDEVFDRLIRGASNGAFSAAGMLDREIRNTVNEARGNVVLAARGLVDAGIALEASANRSISERDVAIARQRLAVAEFELAMDRLENAVRG